MLRLLAAVGDASLGVRFLDRVVRTRYAGGEHDALLDVIELIGPPAAGKFLPDFLGENFASLAEDNLTLLREVGELEAAGGVWRETLRDALRAVFQALPPALGVAASHAAGCRARPVRRGRPVGHGRLCELVAPSGRRPAGPQLDAAGRTT